MLLVDKRQGRLRVIRAGDTSFGLHPHTIEVGLNRLHESTRNVLCLEIFLQLCSLSAVLKITFSIFRI